MAGTQTAPGSSETDHDDHPTESQYTEVFAILAVLTAAEVGLYFAPVPSNIAIPSLIILTVFKFVLVMFWFMHLRFDNLVFRRLFYVGLVLAGVIYAVVAALSLL